MSVHQLYEKWAPHIGNHTHRLQLLRNNLQLVSGNYEGALVSEICMAKSRNQVNQFAYHSKMTNLDLPESIHAQFTMLLHKQLALLTRVQTLLTAEM